MFFTNVAFWAAVICGIVWTVRGGLHRSSGGHMPEAIIDQRVASGEITLEEHDRLSQRPPGPASPSSRQAGQG